MSKNLADKIPRSYIDKLAYSNVMREGIIRSAIKSLGLQPGSTGLDAGCGIGTITMWLSEAIAPEGQVIGLDLSSEFIEYANKLAQNTGFSRSVSFRQGDINKLPFNDNNLDWVWSCDCVWTDDSVKELARVVKPGGTIAILMWSSQLLLPGYPMLEAKLNATSAGTAPYHKNIAPEKHFMRALGWLKATGLIKAKAETLIGNLYAPLSEDAVIALLSLFDMRWSGAESEMTKDDWSLYQRLIQPDSPDFILNEPDYHTFYTYSMFYGKVSG